MFILLQGGCFDDMDPGYCGGDFSRWQYNEDEKRCESFKYGGCGGTGNRFGSRSACEEKCPVTVGVGRTPGKYSI